MSSLVGQGVAMLAIFVLGLPSFVLALVAYLTGSLVVGWVTLVAGVVIGTAGVWVGVRRGGAIFDRREPELLQQVASYR
ncbi:hypothetical protein [Paraoerskovia sediminicola]|nr:hypothetical protein [Paraoerskovia sediminicola]